MEKAKIYGTNYRELAEALKEVREAGKTVVMASGVHLTYFMWVICGC